MSEKTPPAVNAAILDRLVILDAEFWWSNYGVIDPKDAQRITGPTPNIMQQKAFAYYRECQAKGRPCLIMILKPRQKGASTWAEGMIYHHLRRIPNLKGLLMADQDETTETVMEMFRTYATEDKFPWEDGHGAPGQNIAKDGDQSKSIELVNGSFIKRKTANSKNAGRSNTFQAAHWDEECYFEISDSKDPMLASLQAFTDELPIALGIRTSTANGASGAFYDDWINDDNDWHKIFAAWFEFEDSKRYFESDSEREEFKNSLREDEIEEMERFPGQVSFEHLNWRRRTIQNKCKGDVDRFRREYPSDPISCFRLSGSPRYNLGALGKMKDIIKRRPAPERGVLSSQDGGIHYGFSRDAGGDVYIAEHPKLGCRYIVSADTCAGEDQQLGGGGGNKHDWHDVQVWRAGYLDFDSKTERVPKIVARHRSQLDSDMLAEIIAGFSIFYGRCLVVPEINGESAHHIIKLLLKLRVPVYRRQKISGDVMKKTRDERLQSYGWRTGPLNRKYIIDELVEPIREMEVDFTFLEVVEEFESFIRDKRGKAVAMPGKHDDAVLSAAIGYYNLSHAKELLPDTRNIDLKRLRTDPNYLMPDSFKMDTW